MRNRSLRRLLAGFSLYAVSEASSWVAILVWAHRVGGAASVGLLAGSMLGVAALVTPLAASLAERLPRGRALAAAHLVGGLAFCAAAVSAEAGSTWAVFAVLLVAIAAQSVIPPLHGATAPQLATAPTDLVAINVAGVNVQSLAVFVGPAVAAALMLVAGPGLVFLAAAVMSALGVMVSLGIRSVGEQRSHAGSPVAAVRLLFRVARDPNHRLLLGLGGAEMIVVAALDVLVVIFALEVWETGESGAGLAAATLGVGSIIGGALAIGMVTRARLAPAVVAGAVIRSLAMVALAFTSGVAALLFVAVAGVGFSVIDVASRTLLQRTSLPEAMARVFGVFESLQVAGYAVGTFTAPLIADRYGVPVTLVIVGLGFLVVFVARAGALRESEERAVASASEVRLIRSSPLLGALPPPSQERLAHRGTWTTLLEGEVLIEEGSTSDGVYLIGDGSVEISKNGDRVTVLGPGSVVGEIAPLRGVSRTATVRALSGVSLLGFTGSRFVEAVRSDGAGWSEADDLADRRRGELGEED